VNLAERQGNGLLVRCWDSLRFIPAYCTAKAGIKTAKEVNQLTKQAQKSIRSLEKQIAAHEKKLADFKASPTVRPGMENLSKEMVEKQQQGRIEHLETEIQTFKNNIQKIMNGEL
jgi:hypothetical protein